MYDNVSIQYKKYVFSFINIFSMKEKIKVIPTPKQTTTVLINIFFFAIDFQCDRYYNEIMDNRNNLNIYIM